MPRRICALPCATGRRRRRAGASECHISVSQVVARTLVSVPWVLQSLGSTRDSRFADSSDEEGGLSASGFRSRFEDSSDEEDAPPPPLSMPKTVRSAAGPASQQRRYQPTSAGAALPEEDEEDEDADLLASSDEEKPSGVGTESSRKTHVADGIRRSGSGRGTLVAPADAGAGAFMDNRPSTSKRRSFMSSLLRKRPDSRGKIFRPEVMDSAARRDTKLERSAGKLRDIRGSTGGEDVDEYGEDLEQMISPRTLPASPKLQKRVASHPVASEAWALPGRKQQNAAGLGEVGDAGLHLGEESVGEFNSLPHEDDLPALRRPTTSGNIGTRTLSGPMGTIQSGFLQRRVASTGVLSIDAGMDGTGKKKKKFGALRRMFKLD